MSEQGKSPRGCRNRRSAFTLIEVMLAVTLSAFLMGLITTAIYLNVRVLQRQQKEIERSQIARTVLVSITGDLRAAIQYKPADVTGLDALNVSSAAMLGAMGGMDPSALEGLAGAAGGGALGGGGGAGQPLDDAAADEPETSASQNIATGQTEVVRPGLYGNAMEIMVDISRLPRLDQYDPLVVGGDQTAISLPTDVKTISYFVSQESEQSRSMMTGRDAAAAGGLYRRQLDRAVAAYSSNLAATLASAGNTQLIANEVIGIQFRYYDGEQWVNEWDSDQMGGFPAAVEVTIIVDNERVISDDVSYSMQDNPQAGEIYRSVINLPVAEILESDDSGNAGGEQ